MRFRALVVPILLVAAGAQADTLLKIKARLETTPPRPVTKGSLTETVMLLWVGDHRLREDSPDLTTSVIRRFDRGKLYFLDHRAKTYAEVDLPFDPAKGFGPPSGKPAAAPAAILAAKDREPRQSTPITITPTDEVRRIGPWNARKVVVVSHESLGEMTAIKWMSTEVGVDEGTLTQWQVDAIALPPGSLDSGQLESQRRLLAIPGYPVLEETRSSGGGIEFRWHKELVSAEKKEPPAGLYEPPADYVKVRVDQIQMAPPGRPDHR